MYVLQDRLKMLVAKWRFSFDKYKLLSLTGIIFIYMSFLQFPSKYNSSVL